jgi:hypothetical protein
MPKFSIIIPTATQFDLLQKCLESIVTYTDLDDVEIIVVANGAPQEVRALDYPINLLWFDEMIGFTRAINEAFKVAKGEYLILLNDDCELLGQPKNHWLDRLYAPFSDDKVAITGPLYDRCPSTDRDFLLFFCVMISKRALNDLGGHLDEIFNPGAGEDCSFCHDAEDRGWKMVAVGGEPVYADRGDPTLPAHQQGQWVTSFPLWHKAGCTVSTIEGWPEIFARNAEILRKRYGVNLDRAKTIEGWMADSELEWLARQAKKSTVFVEIGSWCGRSSRAIADNLPADAILVCVDTFCGSSGEPDAHKTAKEREGDGVYMKFMANLYDHVRLGRVMPLRMESANAATFLKSMGVIADTIFIDGDHSMEGVKRDIEAWRPLLKEGGMLCGHDYYLPEQNPLAWIGVRECVDTMFPEAIQPPDTTIWTVKDMSAWERLQQLPVTESYKGYGGFFSWE